MTTEEKEDNYFLYSGILNPNVWPNAMKVPRSSSLFFSPKQYRKNSTRRRRQIHPFYLYTCRFFDLYRVAYSRPRFCAITAFLNMKTWKTWKYENSTAAARIWTRVYYVNPFPVLPGRTAPERILQMVRFILFYQIKKWNRKYVTRRFYDWRYIENFISFQSCNDISAIRITKWGTIASRAYFSR